MNKEEYLINLSSLYMNNEIVCSLGSAQNIKLIKNSKRLLVNKKENVKNSDNLVKVIIRCNYNTG